MQSTAQEHNFPSSGFRLRIAKNKAQQGFCLTLLRWFFVYRC